MDDDFNSMATVVRRIVARELDKIDAKGDLSDEDADKLAKLALVMQRIGVKAAGKGSDTEEATDAQLMRAADRAA